MPIERFSEFNLMVLRGTAHRTLGPLVQSKPPLKDAPAGPVVMASTKWRFGSEEDQVTVRPVLLLLLSMRNACAVRSRDDGAQGSPCGAKGHFQVSLPPYRLVMPTGRLSGYGLVVW